MREMRWGEVRSVPASENRSKHDLVCKLRVEQLSTGGMKSWDERERESTHMYSVQYGAGGGFYWKWRPRLYRWLIRFPGRSLSSPRTSSQHKAKQPGDLEFHPGLFLLSSFILQCTSARPPRLNWNKKPLYAAVDFVSASSCPAWLSRPVQPRQSDRTRYLGLCVYGSPGFGLLHPSPPVFSILFTTGEGRPLGALSLLLIHQFPGIIAVVLDQHSQSLCQYVDVKESNEKDFSLILFSPADVSIQNWSKLKKQSIVTTWNPPHCPLSLLLRAGGK